MVDANSIRDRQLGGAMAGDQMIRRPCDRFGGLGSATIDHVRAPRVKPATRGRVHRARDIATDDLPRTVSMRVGTGNRGK